MRVHSLPPTARIDTSFSPAIPKELTNDIIQYLARKDVSSIPHISPSISKDFDFKLWFINHKPMERLHLLIRMIESPRSPQKLHELIDCHFCAEDLCEDLANSHNFELLFIATRHSKLDTIKKIFSRPYTVEPDFKLCLSEEAVNASNVEVLSFLVDIQAIDPNRNLLSLAYKTVRLQSIETYQYLRTFSQEAKKLDKQVHIYALYCNHFEFAKKVRMKLSGRVCDQYHAVMAFAARNGYKEILDWLLEQGARIDYSDNLALRGAISMSQETMVPYLLDRGASTDGLSEQWLRINCTNDKIMKLIRKSQGRPNTSIFSHFLKHLFDRG